MFMYVYCLFCSLIQFAYNSNIYILNRQKVRHWFKKKNICMLLSVLYKKMLKWAQSDICPTKCFKNYNILHTFSALWTKSCGKYFSGLFWILEVHHHHPGICGKGSPLVGCPVPLHKHQMHWSETLGHLSIPDHTFHERTQQMQILHASSCQSRRKESKQLSSQWSRRSAAGQADF